MTSGFTIISRHKFYENLVITMFLLVVVILTRQVPLRGISFLMNIALLFFFIIQTKYIIQFNEKNNLLLLISFIAVAAVMLVYSNLAGNTTGNSFRMFVIIVFIQLAFFVKPKIQYINILLTLLIIQALFLIGFHLVLNVFFDIVTYQFIRAYFRHVGWGDVYTYNGFFYNIQVMGNALLPFGVFVSSVYYRGKKRIILTAILLLGTLVAGNFAFMLGCIMFVALIVCSTKIYNKRRLIVVSVLSFIAIAVIAVPAYTYLEDTIARKAIESNPTRIDQTEVLMSDLTVDVPSVIFGRGLGNTVDKKTIWRDYTGDVYFELQSLYFLNQLGLVNFLFFVLLNILFVLVFFRSIVIKLIYVSYIFYAFFNPYFLDTSHIVVIVTLIGLNQVMEERAKLNTARLTH